ncbi:MAG: NAD(P)-dependent oxidoreductase, partial [Thermotogota bacterium]|nr:NAD(P)-dependent oxidoreductase [Thermotogota bacterium]
LEAMRINDVEKIIFPSSMAIYGNNIDAKEDDLYSIDPLTPYDLSKFQSERFCEMYYKCYGIDYLIFRFSYLYGLYQSQNHLISQLFERIKTTDTVEIGNDVSRDFLNAKDAAQLIINNLNFGDSDIYNVGTRKETKLSEVIQLISQKMNINIKLGNNPSFSRESKFERWREKANIDKIVGTGWKPSISIEKGLEEFVGWNNARDD